MAGPREALESVRLYAVMDLTSPDSTIFDRADAACQGGADVLQLRSKVLAGRALYELGREIRKITIARGKLFIVNDRPDLALALGADGVHLGQDDLPLAQVRNLCQRSGEPLLIGKSTHSCEQAEAAVREGADYIGIGPVFSTPTKPGYPEIGLETVGTVTRETPVPVVAIGGIDHTNMDRVLHAGARRVAVVRAIFQAENVYDAARKLKAKIEITISHV